MEKKLLILLLVMVFISFASAEIILEQQPEGVYNFGDPISIPVTIKTSTDASGVFQMILLCEGHEVEFYKNGVDLKSGEEKELEASLVLEKSMIGELFGICKIKSIFNDEYVLTKEFEISKSITVNVKELESEYAPSENILIKGDAVREDGKDVNGFVKLELVKTNNSETINKVDTVKNGFFTLNLSLPENMAAGEYVSRLDVYEKDSNGETTNNGFTNFAFNVKQVPENLEVIIENNEIEPGTSLNIKNFLHDQTGENIPASSNIKLKDSRGNLINEADINTGESFEYSINKNETPANWSLKVESQGLVYEDNFEILENPEIEVRIINKTVLIENIGNVFYNHSVLVEIGNETEKINATLELGETKEYELYAPDGEYLVKVSSDNGETFTESNVLLTGSSIEVKEGNDLKLFNPIAWFFIIFVLGFVAFLIYKKGYKKVFLGRIHKKPKNSQDKKSNSEHEKKQEKKILDSKNNAILSLSIQGQKQNSSLICLKLKNYEEIKSGQGNVKETLNKLANLDEKVYVYENTDNIMFIIAPEITKTFKNEIHAVELSQKIKRILDDHNRLFKQEIKYGLGVSSGELVVKKQKHHLEFMSVGKLVPGIKKIAKLSESEILLSEDIKKKLEADVKTEKHEKEGTDVYTIKEIKDRSKNKKFLENFVKRNFENNKSEGKK